MNEMQNNSRVTFGSAEEAHFIFEAMGQPIVQITNVEYPDNQNWCDFIFEPLQRGYGTTLGNTLRRVLLASIPGAAVCYCRFDDGPSHEYTTIPGVLEDVTEIMLNLKSLPVKLVSSETNATLRLEISGLKGGDTYEVKASDIQAHADIEILNPDHHIATITDQKTSLNMEIGVRRGFGYMQFDDHRPQDMNPRWASKTAMPVGVIPIDSKFSPVISANFRVEPTRVGQDTSFDKLILTVKTNGGISPDEALRHANRKAEQVPGKHRRGDNPRPVELGREKPARTAELRREISCRNPGKAYPVFAEPDGQPGRKELRIGLE